MKLGQKKKYVKPSIKCITLESGCGFLTGSHTEEQVLVEKEFNIYTDSYEDKSFDWDHISFD